MSQNEITSTLLADCDQVSANEHRPRCSVIFISSHISISQKQLIITIFTPLPWSLVFLGWHSICIRNNEMRFLADGGNGVAALLANNGVGIIINIYHIVCASSGFFCNAITKVHQVKHPPMHTDSHQSVAQLVTLSISSRRFLFLSTSASYALTRSVANYFHWMHDNYTSYVSELSTEREREKKSPRKITESKVGNWNVYSEKSANFRFKKFDLQTNKKST